MNLLVNHEYVIITTVAINNISHVEKYTGKYVGGFSGGIPLLFCDVARVKTPYHVKPTRIFTKFDEYYDLKGMRSLIENAKRARQTMEKRALDMILKRIINEEFQW